MRDTLASMLAHLGGEDRASAAQCMAARRIAALEAELIFLEDSFACARADGGAPDAADLDLYNRGDDPAPLDWPTSVLVNSEMSPRRVVICGVCLQDMPKMRLTPDDHMVEAFTADRPDRTFDVSILPWRSGRDGVIANAHYSKPPSERLAIGTIIVTDEKARNSVPRKGLGNLAGQPFRRRIGRDADP